MKKREYLQPKIKVLFLQSESLLINPSSTEIGGLDDKEPAGTDEEPF